MNGISALLRRGQRAPLTLLLPQEDTGKILLSMNRKWVSADMASPGSWISQPVELWEIDLRCLQATQSVSFCDSSPSRPWYSLCASWSPPRNFWGQGTYILFCWNSRSYHNYWHRVGIQYLLCLEYIMDGLPETKVYFSKEEINMEGRKQWGSRKWCATILI